MKEKICDCGCDLSRHGNVIRRYSKDGYFDNEGIFCESSSLNYYDDVCGKCGREV
jgi:hypothetical protein